MQKQLKDQYSFGIICKRGDKYLTYNSKNLWRFHKGHFEDSDLMIVSPYDDFKVIIPNRLYEFPHYMQAKPGSMVTAAIREFMEESGFILPSQALRVTLKQKYEEQGKMLFMDGESIIGVQQEPYKFTNRKGKVVTKYVTFFFAEVFDEKPKASNPKHQNAFTKEEWAKLSEQGKAFYSTYQLVEIFQDLLEKHKNKQSIGE